MSASRRVPGTGVAGSRDNSGQAVFQSGRTIASPPAVSMGSGFPWGLWPSRRLWGGSSRWPVVPGPIFGHFSGPLYVWEQVCPEFLHWVSVFYYSHSTYLGVIDSKHWLTNISS